MISIPGCSSAVSPASAMSTAFSGVSIMRRSLKSTAPSTFSTTPVPDGVHAHTVLNCERIHRYRRSRCSRRAVKFVLLRWNSQYDSMPVEEIGPEPVGVDLGNVCVLL
ncbi:hypothetical protein GPALN_014545 [Globodera pallida]|nr:hypothetical protein GPALN_014545 [Globodera pallida]